jgi:AraC-like DNA-binding protein
MTIEQISEILATLHGSKIDPKDVTEISRRLDLSRFTVYQYFNSNGKSVSTGADILKTANDIIEERKLQAERTAILSEYKND